jgi:signal transduction histidine kinase
LVYRYRSETAAGLAELAGTVAHELNNIFTAVSGNLSLLGEELRVTGPASETIDEIIRTARRGIALSEKLQAFSSRQPLRRQKVDIGKILSESVSELRRTFPRLNISISSPQGPSIVYIDEAKMQATILDLAANAAAATNGNGNLRIRTARNIFVRDNPHGLRPGPYVVIQTSDDGVGMNGETARRAAEPAFSTRSSHIDSGWGLSSCVGFIRQCAGMTQLSTAEGHGTIVQIYLPIEPTSDGQPDNFGSDILDAAYSAQFPPSVSPFVFYY